MTQPLLPVLRCGRHPGTGVASHLDGYMEDPPEPGLRDSRTSWHGMIDSLGPPAACEWEFGVLKSLVLSWESGRIPSPWVLPALQSLPSFLYKPAASCCCHCCRTVPKNPSHSIASLPGILEQPSFCKLLVSLSVILPLRLERQFLWPAEPKITVTPEHFPCACHGLPHSL